MDMKKDSGFVSDVGTLAEGIRAAGVGVWRWAVESDELQWSQNLEAVHGLPEGSFDGTLASFQRDIHPDDAAHVWARISATLESGEPYRVVYRTNPRKGIDTIWVEAAGGVVDGEDGRRYLTGVCMDVSERMRSERELKRRLAQQQAIEQFGSFAFTEPDFQKILDCAVETAAKVLDVPLTKVLEFTESADRLLLRSGVGWDEGLVGKATVGIDEASQAGFTLAHTGPVVVDDLLTESRFSGPPLLTRHGVRSGMSVVIPGDETRPFGVFGVHTREPRRFDQADCDFLLSLTNIVASSARHFAAAQHHHLLVREMAHRAGNMLQLVATIANQTFGRDDDLARARASFSGRLASLSRANYLVARGGWTSTRFRALAEEVLSPFIDRIAVSGREVLLPPELCFDMGLVLHELATNAVKYGSLGDTNDAVRLKWEIWEEGDAAKFGISWLDPKSAGADETQRGFGTRLFDALISSKWGGSYTAAAADGYRFTCEIPLPARS
jgi:PAS domain S-box-containing protein